MASTSNLDDPRRHVRLELERVSGIAGSDFPHNYPGEDHSWNLRKFAENLQVKIAHISETTCEFDLVGIDSSIANAIRRVLISEVPTVAIEDVFVYNNTSIIQDEVLSHRLGLIPLQVDPRKIKMKGADSPNDQNTIVMGLQVACERNREAKKGETDPSLLYINDCVYASDLVWKPAGRQETTFGTNTPRSVVDDVLIAKLRPGQSIELDVHAVKGIGKDHAKFSPVATASYRLLPHIIIKEPIPSSDADEFAACFTPGVVSVETDSKTKQKTVKVVEPRKDTVSREVLRHDKFKDKVELTRIRDHFIFSIESVGAYQPEDLLPEAINVLLGKIDSVESSLKALDSQTSEGRS
ncbi:dna-directed rna polymerases i and iii 40 kda polypeptide [Phaffia rhodozyma]|uniref:DNA-directed RNA polymerases I and III subunit RPAC1 n=1 Tax=Phaffia rhodozyma TaxID=264483 RepID=A0A0F7SXM6_PHARH|nr:dna-directed rna polymerases i and iii 40 kda polypeptide [Phaffia rhodozyma]